VEGVSPLRGAVSLRAIRAVVETRPLGFHLGVVEPQHLGEGAMSTALPGTHPIDRVITRAVERVITIVIRMAGCNSALPGTRPGGRVTTIAQFYICSRVGVR